MIKNVNAQFQISNNNPALDVWGQVDPSTGLQSIGIGDFNGQSPKDWPQAALHINTGYMPASPTFNPGEVFRTNCPDTSSTYWRMFTGDTMIGYVEQQSRP